MASGNWFSSAFAQALSGDIKTTDTIKGVLLTSAYTFNPANVHYSDVSADEASGTGYTAGGVVLSSVSVSTTAADSWGTAWAASTAYTVGEVVRPATANGYLYRVLTAGTSGASAPSWPTGSGATVTDGTVTWEQVGQSVTVLTSGNAQWTSMSAAFRYLVLVDTASGSASTDPLVCCVDFGAQSPSGVTVTLEPDPSLGWCYTTAY